MALYSVLAKNLLRFGAIAAALTAWTAHAAQTYSYALVAQTGQNIGGQKIFDFTIGCSPGIDDLGNVAFVARLSLGTNAIFTKSGVIAKSGDGIRTGVSLDEVGCPAVSHSGMVAFIGNFTATPPLFGQGLFSYTIGGALPFQQVLESDAGFTSPAINDHGQIATAAATQVGGPQTLFLVGPGGTQALIVRGTTTIGGQTVTGTLGINPNSVALNDLGTVVASSSLSGGSAVVTPTSIVAEAGQTIGGKTLTGVGSPLAVNNSGTILFGGVYGLVAQNQFGIFSSTSAVVLSGQSIGGFTIAGPGNPLINDYGVIAFEALFSGKTGLFTTTEPVIAEGQTVAGKTIQGNGLQGINFNNAGQFVIQAAFTDGTQGIIIATPTTPMNFVIGSDPSPAGLGFTIDSGPTVYTAPHTFQFAPTTTHTVNWTPVQDTAPGTQYTFTNWLDGSLANPRTFVIPSVDVNFIGNFKTQYQLTTSVSPTGGGSITAGGFFDPQTQVSISAAPAAGFVFSGFSGDLSGTANPQSVTLSVPRNVTANFTPLVPVSLSAAVTNKALVSPGVRFYDIQISNQGPGNAFGVGITQLPLSTLSGTGTVTNMTSLPIAVGDIAAGSSKTVRVTLGVPATVTRFRLGENGTLQNSQHQVATFSLLQAVFP